MYELRVLKFRNHYSIYKLFNLLYTILPVLFYFKSDRYSLFFANFFLSTSKSFNTFSNLDLI